MSITCATSSAAVSGFCRREKFPICPTSWFDRVYLNISEEYVDYRTFDLDFAELIEGVAKAHKMDGIAILFDERNNTVCEGHTKNFIIKETRNFVSGLEQRVSKTENMATFVSKRQLQKLIRAFSGGKVRISAYGLIYIYVIFTLLPSDSDEAQRCVAFIKYIHSMVKVY